MSANLWEGPAGANTPADASPVVFTPSTAGSIVELGSGAHNLTEQFVLRLSGDGVASEVYARTGFIAVRTGEVLEIGGWTRRVSGTAGKGLLRLLAYDGAFGNETVVASWTVGYTAGAWENNFSPKVLILPSFYYVRIEWRIDVATPAASEVWEWDDVYLRYAPPMQPMAIGRIEVYATSGVASGYIDHPELGSDWFDPPFMLGWFYDTSGSSPLVAGYFTQSKLGYVAATSGGAVTVPVSVVTGRAWGEARMLAGPNISLTTPYGVASTDILTATAHGLVTGDLISFSVLTGGAGLTVSTPFYRVMNPTANTFQLWDAGGAGYPLPPGAVPVNFTTNITGGTLRKSGVIRVTLNVEERAGVMLDIEMVYMLYREFVTL